MSWVSVPVSGRTEVEMYNHVESQIDPSVKIINLAIKALRVVLDILYDAAVAVNQEYANYFGDGLILYTPSGLAVQIALPNGSVPDFRIHPRAISAIIIKGKLYWWYLNVDINFYLPFEIILPVLNLSDIEIPNSPEWYYYENGVYAKGSEMNPPRGYTVGMFILDAAVFGIIYYIIKQLYQMNYGDYATKIVNKMSTVNRTFELREIKQSLSSISSKLDTVDETTEATKTDVLDIGAKTSTMLGNVESIGQLLGVMKDELTLVYERMMGLLPTVPTKDLDTYITTVTDEIFKLWENIQKLLKTKLFFNH